MVITARGRTLTVHCLSYYQENGTDQEWKTDPSKHQQQVTIHIDKRSALSRTVKIFRRLCLAKACSLLNFFPLNFKY